jgi:hypothetical protein
MRHLSSFFDNMIWHLANIQPGLGVCITSQIGNVHAKVRAVSALLNVFEGTDPLIKKLNKISDDARGSIDERARAVHDTWSVTDAGDVAQIANAIVGKTAMLEARAGDMKRLQKTLSDLGSLMIRANDLLQEIRTSVAPSKDKWRKPPPDVTLGKVEKTGAPPPVYYAPRVYSYYVPPVAYGYHAPRFGYNYGYRQRVYGGYSGHGRNW